MPTSLSAGVDRLRRPEYTGENRCMPCTIVNLLLAVVLANVVLLVGLAVDAPAAGTIGGFGVFLLAAAVIYLRGYLIPGTPWLTRTYFPDWLLRHFDKRPPGVATDDLDVEATLFRAGVVTECEDRDDLCLEEDFRSDWRAAVAAVRADDASRDDLAAVLDVDRDRLSVRDHGESFAVALDSRRIGQWESREAFLADMAAERALRGRYDDWPSLDVRQRSAVLAGLRVFLERCPGCDEPVSMDQEVVESCCRTVDVVAVTCDRCDVRLFEAEADTQPA